MPLLLQKALPILTLAMSLPLFLSFQLKRPPEFLEGLPFVFLWSWGVLSAITLPFLMVLESACCVWLLWHRGEERALVTLHATAIVISVLAQIVFVAARSSGA